MLRLWKIKARSAQSAENIMILEEVSPETRNIEQEAKPKESLWLNALFVLLFGIPFTGFHLTKFSFTIERRKRK